MCCVQGPFDLVIKPNQTFLRKVHKQQAQPGNTSANPIEAAFQVLGRYRLAFGLPMAIVADEDTPLLVAANSKRKRASNSTVLKAMIEIMGRAVAIARSREQHELADRLAGATTHWLRHSCFSHLAQATGDLVMVRSLAGHARLDTTSRYLHAEADDLHRQVSGSLTSPSSS